MTTEVLRINASANPSIFPTLDEGENCDAIVTIYRDDEYRGRCITYQIVLRGEDANPNVDDEEFLFDDFESTICELRQLAAEEKEF